MPGMNIKIGVPIFIVVFLLSAGLLYGGAQLVKVSNTAVAEEGNGGETPSAGPVSVTIEAKNIQFDKRTITANAGSQVNITFINNDAGVLHNVAFYTNRSASTKIFASETTTGVSTHNFSFDAPAAPGSYFFRCDVHPDTMTGTFSVR
jgi:plastocyanin